MALNHKNFKWVEVKYMYPGSENHGVELYHLGFGIHHPIAFLEGYGWRSGEATEITVKILASDSKTFEITSFDARIILKEVESCILDFLQDKDLHRYDKIKKNIYAWFNGWNLIKLMIAKVSL